MDVHQQTQHATADNCRKDTRTSEPTTMQKRGTWQLLRSTQGMHGICNVFVCCACLPCAILNRGDGKEDAWSHGMLLE